MASYTKRGQRWLCRVYSPILRKSIGRTGRTKRLAFAAADARRRELEGGLVPESDTLTVADYLRRWLDQHAGHVAERTLRRYRSLIELHVLPTLGSRPIGRLHPMNVEGLYQRLATDGRRDGKPGGLHPRTIGHVHRVLHKALADAVRLQVVSRNVAAAARPPTIPRRRIDAPSVDTVQQVLTAVAGTLVERETWFTAYTGVRVGELVALRWADVDLDARTVRVARAMTREPHRGIVVTPTKTEASDRLVPLAEPIVIALRAHRAVQAQHRLNVGPAWQDLDLLFPSAVGTPQDPRNVLRRFQAALDRAGIPRMRWHDLRHCCASLMLSAGIPLAVVSELLGHSSIQITKDTYGHITADAKHQAVQRLHEVLAR